jgi:hypothetical protein
MTYNGQQKCRRGIGPSHWHHDNTRHSQNIVNHALGGIHFCILLYSVCTSSLLVFFFCIDCPAICLYNTISMSPTGFDPAVPASEEPHIVALDRFAAGIGRNDIRNGKYHVLLRTPSKKSVLYKVLRETRKLKQYYTLTLFFTLHVYIGGGTGTFSSRNTGGPQKHNLGISCIHYGIHCVYTNRN